MNWGKKTVVVQLKFYHKICLEKTTKAVIIGLSRESNPEPPEYETGLPTAHYRGCSQPHQPVIWHIWSLFVAVPQLRRLVVGFSQRRPKFAPRSVHVGSVVDIVVLGQVFLRVLRFSSVHIIPPLLHIHSYITWGMDTGPERGPVPVRHSLTPWQQEVCVFLDLFSDTHLTVQSRISSNGRAVMNDEYGWNWRKGVAHLQHRPSISLDWLSAVASRSFNQKDQCSVI
jgi:hypothetical protein